MARSDVHTAFGGTQLGMALPLFGFGALLVSFGGAAAGLDDTPSILPIAALAILSSALLAMAGALLLWGHRLEPAPRPAARPSPARVAARASPARVAPRRVSVKPSPPRRVPSVIVDFSAPERAFKERRP